MTDTNPAPTFIYKLVPSSSPVPDPLPDALPVSELDQKSGFLHMSTSKQVPRTLKHFFSEDEKVYVLRVPYAIVEKHIRWEDPKGEVCGPRGGEGMFPHIYNGLKLGVSEVERVVILEKEDGWDTALEKAQEWLVY